MAKHHRDFSSILHRVSAASLVPGSPEGVARYFPSASLACFKTALSILNTYSMDFNILSLSGVGLVPLR
jgi:hypothetical protein